MGRRMSRGGAAREGRRGEKPATVAWNVHAIRPRRVRAGDSSSLRATRSAAPGGSRDRAALGRHHLRAVERRGQPCRTRSPGDAGNTGAAGRAAPAPGRHLDRLDARDPQGWFLLRAPRSTLAGGDPARHGRRSRSGRIARNRAITSTWAAPSLCTVVPSSTSRSTLASTIPVRQTTSTAPSPLMTLPMCSTPRARPADPRAWPIRIATCCTTCAVIRTRCDSPPRID